MSKINSFLHDCPFCCAQKAAFKIETGVPIFEREFEWSTLCRCGVCGKVSLFELETNFRDRAPNHDNSKIDRILNYYPSFPTTKVALYIPENVEKPLLEAEASYLAGHFTAAGSCYRKAIERSIRQIDPSIDGMLNARIRQLEKIGKLPRALIELLDHVRLFANEAMHEDDIDPTKEDCEKAREFVDLFLTFSFTLPHRISETRTALKS